MGKIRKNVTLDEDLCKMAHTKLGMPLSTFLNIALAEELKASDEITEVKKEITEYESHLTLLRSKLCRLEKDKAAEIDKGKSLMTAFSTLSRIYETHGKIGENQIKNVANQQGVSFSDLVKLCRDEGYHIVKGFEPINETRGWNGGSLR